jgi:hypothetical protein
MRAKAGFLSIICALAAVGTLACGVPAQAQTEGMDRRDDRRDDRAGGRAAKQACKAGDEKTRAECREMKRDAKHGKPQGGDPSKAGQPPAANPPAAQ